MRKTVFSDNDRLLRPNAVDNDDVEPSHHARRSIFCAVVWEEVVVTCAAAAEWRPYYQQLF